MFCWINNIFISLSHTQIPWNQWISCILPHSFQRLEVMLGFHYPWYHSNLWSHKTINIKQGLSDILRWLSPYYCSVACLIQAGRALWGVLLAGVHTLNTIYLERRVLRLLLNTRCAILSFVILNLFLFVVHDWHVCLFKIGLPLISWIFVTWLYLVW